MSDRTTRGTPAFNSLLWDTTGIPALEEPTVPIKLAPPPPRPIERTPVFSFVLILTGAVLVAFTVCSCSLFLLALDRVQ